MSIAARQWHEVMEYLYALEDLLEAVLDAEHDGFGWPAEVVVALDRARTMKHVWYNREE